MTDMEPTGERAHWWTVALIVGAMALSVWLEWRAIEVTTPEPTRYVVPNVYTF